MGLLGTIFLRMIKAIIAPLLFGTLVYGIAGTGSLKTMGRIGGKAILYFEIVTTIALFIGLGRGESRETRRGRAARSGNGFRDYRKRPRRFRKSWSTSFPPASSMRWRAATCCRSSCSRSFSEPHAPPSESKARPVVEFCESLAEVMFRFTNYVMLFAPFGVFGAIAATIGQKGLGVLLNLGKLVATLYVAQAIVVVTVFGASAVIAGSRSAASSSTLASLS